MLTLIHGDDIVSCRKALDDLRTKYDGYEKVLFDGAKITLPAFVSAAGSLSLFGKEKLIIVENLLSTVSTKDKEEILNFVKNQKNLPELIFWEQKEISKLTAKKYFAAGKIIFCQLPPILFKFLDAIGDKPPDQILALSSKLVKERDAEFILSMLIRQWRNLIIAKDLGILGFESIPSWQAYKFLNQARYFELEKLISAYRQLLSLDQKVKMGLTAYNLNQLLDIFLLSLYHQN